MMNMSSRLPSPDRQQGAALVVVLVLLLVMTLLGLASLRGTLMNQRMSANTFDRNVSMQVAEAALREGEAKLPGIAATAFSSTCPNGLCTQLVAAPNTLDRWANSAFTGWQNGTSVTTSETSLTSGGAETMTMAPQYFIEQNGSGPVVAGCDQAIPTHPWCLTPHYRVTARNADPTKVGDRSVVVLQSNYSSASP